MNSTRRGVRSVFILLPWIMIALVTGRAADTTLLDLAKLSFFYGREYFVLRSGQVQMIAQSDRADVGPAFTFFLFDAQNARQSARKETALNFDPGTGVASSALEVELGSFPFTALGHHTETRWSVAEGIPGVESTWWAGGIRVTERLVALHGTGAFLRSIQLDGAKLIGPETVRLRLRLPAGKIERRGQALVSRSRAFDATLTLLNSVPIDSQPDSTQLTIGPLTISPITATTINTLLQIHLAPPGSTTNISRAESSQPDASADLSLTRQAWARSSAISTDDATVQEIYDKARFGLPGMIADDGTMDAGIFEYGAQWVRDTSNTALGALHAGHFEIARSALVRMLTKMINQEGATMIATSFESPDREQFDQMGELLHLLRNYRDWTGDDSLIRQYRDLLLPLVERPLASQFRDHTGMVHNRREFWERAFDDAYELAYQTWVILGLREAAELAPALGASDRAARWRAEADRIQSAMLSHPTRALVDQGRLIKRRNVTGTQAHELKNFKGYLPDVPLATEQHHQLNPDASVALPIALRIVDPHSDVARRTLDDLEILWNARWTEGGYDRYHTSSQPDQPGPWPFATTFILRAQHEAGLLDRSRRSLEWLNSHPGGHAGAFFEEIPCNRSQAKQCGIVCWTSGEIALFVVRHYLGINFENGSLVIRPQLYPGSQPVSANLRFRQSRLRLQITGPGKISSATVDGVQTPVDSDGCLRLPRTFGGGAVILQMSETHSSHH